MKLTPAETHLLISIKEVKLPKSLRTEEAKLVGDLVEEKILKKIVRALMADEPDE
jgi:hypothetical protein